MMKRWLDAWVLLAVLILALMLWPASAWAQTDERCFPETGYCISGTIRAYWERNGGLAVFGYPISPVLTDTIEDAWTGPVQWFERDRLEDHANEGLGVLGGRLGALYLAQRGTPWAPGQTTSPTGPDCAVFRETGYEVCGRFRTYWQRNGGLERFGYPITPVIEEEIEGRVRTVQYFERRRMEYHPEHAGTPYEVLLGLLGRALYDPRSNGTTAVRQIAVTYLDALAGGHYGQAVHLYGGSYDVLRDWNPDVAPDDYVRLLERGCTHNGLQCLPVRRVIGQRQLSAEATLIMIELTGRDGGLFVDPVNNRSQFEFTVSHPLQQPMTVLELPPYLP